MSVIGLKELDRKLQELSKVDVKKSVEDGIKTVGSKARLECSNFKQPSGKLKQSIHEIVYERNDSIVGVCYTNEEYSPYVEFGTGPVGQANHENVSPDVDYAYGQTGWTIPGRAMDPDKAERYGLGLAKGKNGEIIGYYTNGQPAKPFMYPALKDNKDTVLKDFKTDFIANIKKVTK